ncbi:MAG: type II secretion system F family protein [Actinobacteria bacterium]|nr:type II secretion system F family protein [Actinomycetota bacterium]
MNNITISILFSTVAFLVVMVISEISTEMNKRLITKMKRETVEVEKKDVLSRFKKKISNFLNSTGLKLDVDEFLFINFILYLAMFVVFLIFGIPVILVLFASIVLPFLFIWYFNYKKEKRRIKIERQMEGFLIDLSGILSPIPNILEALKESVGRVNQPLKDEILKIINEVTGANISLEESLKNLSRRFNDKGLINIFSIAMIQAIKIGTKDTGKILKRYADVARRNERIRLEANAKLGYARTQKNVLLIGTIFLYILVLILNPEYISFYSTKIGLFIVIYSILSIIIGVYILNKITSISE